MSRPDKIVLTGATGFIGSALLLKLITDFNISSEAIILIVRRRPDSEESLLANRLTRAGLKAPDYISRFTYVETSFENEENFVRSLNELGANLSGAKFSLVHLAAIIRAKGPQAFQTQQRLNFGVTKDLLKFCEKFGAAQFVYLSSVVAFGASLKSQPRSEKDFVSFSFFSRALSYYKTKRMAHEYVQNFVTKTSRTIFCPSIVHGALERSKDSRSHLRALERGALSWAPRGVINIVSLQRVVNEISHSVFSGQNKAFECRLLVEQNVSNREYFQFYTNLYGKGQKIKSLPWILSPLIILFACLAAVFRVPLAYALQGLVAATANLKFISEKKFLDKDQSVDEILKGIS